MKNLEELIKLLQDEQGKVFVMGPDGNVNLVMLSIEEYQRLLNKPKATGSFSRIDPEAVNRRIIKAQLDDQAPRIPPKVNVQEPLVPVRPRVDMREEVIDPSFDFDSPEDQ